MTSGGPPTALGDAPITMHRVAYVLDSVRDRLDRYRAAFFETEVRAKPYEDLKLLGHEMDALFEGLAEELDREHEAVTAFAGARAAVGDVVRTMDRLRDRGPQEDAQKVADQTKEQLDDDRNRFDASRNRFMDAAREARARG